MRLRSDVAFQLLVIAVAALPAVVCLLVESHRSDVAFARLITEASKRRALSAEVRHRTVRLLEIEPQWEVCDTFFPENRVRWSEKLNMIAAAAQGVGIYITRLYLTEDQEEVETTGTRTRAALQKSVVLNSTFPVVMKRPVIWQRLTVECIACGEDSSQRLRQVNNFYEHLRTLEWKRNSGEMASFVHDLKPDHRSGPQKTDNVAGVPVLRFGFELAFMSPRLDLRNREAKWGRSVPGARTSKLSINPKTKSTR